MKARFNTPRARHYEPLVANASKKQISANCEMQMQYQIVPFNKCFMMCCERLEVVAGDWRVAQNTAVLF